MIVSATETGITIGCTWDFDYLRRELPKEVEFYLQTRPVETPLKITMRKMSGTVVHSEEEIYFTLGSPPAEILAAIDQTEVSMRAKKNASVPAKICSRHPKKPAGG